MFRRALPALALVAACADDGFDQVSYFKDDNSNRVFALMATRPVTIDDATKVAAAQMHTDGRITVVYLFEHGPPVADAVTLASDFASANTAMFEADIRPWRWRLVRGTTGEFTIHDCQKDPNDDGNCRN